nr:unnamed protein product [Callosobruchus chinensis]
MSLRTLFHFGVAAHYWFGCWYDWNHVIIPKHIHNMGDSFGFSGKFKFLTFWNACLQSVFFTICFLNDIIGTNENIPKKTPQIRKLKDTILCTLAFPISMFVGLSFWGIYMLDRELIFPKAISPYFPTWLNHLMHTHIVVTILIEMFLSCCRYPSRKRGLTILTTVMVSYLVWLLVIYFNTGIWVYPILAVLNVPLKAVFFIGNLGVSHMLYMLGEAINKAVWGNEFKRLKLT